MAPFVTSWSAPAQCSTQGQSLGTSPLNGAIHQIGSWDPDGQGPLPVRLVVGGGFNRVDPVPAGGVAAWDPLTSGWSALAGGTDGVVNAVAGLPNGDLIVAGPFRAAGGQAAAGIARFNGVTWAPLGSGLTVASGALHVTAVVALPNGDVVVAGNFTAAGGQPASGLARFAANAWSAIPATLSSNGTIASLVALPGGDLAVGGAFTSIGGVAATNVARWNGTTGPPSGPVSRAASRRWR